MRTRQNHFPILTCLFAEFISGPGRLINPSPTDFHPVSHAPRGEPLPPELHHAQLETKQAEIRNQNPEPRHNLDFLSVCLEMGPTMSQAAVVLQGLVRAETSGCKTENSYSIFN